MSSADKPSRRAPLALWRIAGEFLTILYHLFGDASDIAQRHTLTKKTRSLMLVWIRAGEALIRRLLLIEASHHARGELKPARARALRERKRRPVAFYPEKPEDWRVTFRCFSGDTHALQGDCKQGAEVRRACVSPPRREPQRFHSAWPLALRCEALLRVYNDPAPFARRLACRLYAEPRRAAQLIAYTPPPSVNREGFEATQPNCEHACTHFRDSS